jgi:amidohydrolase
MDALPIQEEGEVEYRSKVPGVMHACGHDVHTTVGLGVALALHANRDGMCGRVKMIFQPAEEAPPSPDGPVGAARMVADGVLRGPDVDAMFALHCMPDLDAGKIGYTAQTLNEWTKKAEVESGMRAGVPTDMAAKMKTLERENRELRQANEILRKASAYFAQSELDRPFKR